MQSRALPRAMTGLPLPQRAIQAVGMPAMPFSTLNPFLARMVVIYLDVSTSWKPSSPKLKTMSTISWTFFSLAATERRDCFLSPSLKAESGCWAFVIITNEMKKRPAMKRLAIEEYVMCLEVLVFQYTHCRLYFPDI